MRNYKRLYLICILSLIVTIVTISTIDNDSSNASISAISPYINKNEPISVTNKNEQTTTTVTNVTTITLTTGTTASTTIEELVQDFDKLIDTYCPVLEFINITHTCLEKLHQYQVENFKLRENLTERIIYHTYWHHHIANDFEFEMMRLNIYSYLATQDLKWTKFVIWSQEQITDDRILKAFSYYVERDFIEFKIINLTVLCNVYPFKLIYNTCINVQGVEIWSFCDFARFLLLCNYGGIWADGDTIFLRNMKPFWHRDFTYRWESHPTYNNALIGFKRLSEMALKIIYTIITKEAVHNPKEYLEAKLKSNSTEDSIGNLAIQFYAPQYARAVAKLNNNDIFNYPGYKVYNSALFDASWLCSLGHTEPAPNTRICSFSDFCSLTFNDTSIVNSFYPGAFSFHVHYKNCGTVKNNSMFYHFKIYFKNLAEKRVKEIFNY